MVPNTAPRRPPRQHHHRFNDYHETIEKTPLVTNQSIASSSEIVDRWIGEAPRSDGNITDDGTVLTKDKHGHTRRISFDNPYLLFEDPTPFVPSMPQNENRATTRHKQNAHHPLFRSSGSTTKPTYSPRYSDNAAASNSSNSIDRLQYDMSSDDEAMFNNDYGATDDEHDNEESKNKAPKEFQAALHESIDNDNYYFEQHNSTTATRRQNHPLLAPSKSGATINVAYSPEHHKYNNPDPSTAVPSEQTRLINANQLERGDYNLTQYGM